MNIYYSYHFGHNADFPFQVECLEFFSKVNVSDYTDEGTYHTLLDNGRTAMLETHIGKDPADRFVEVYF